MIYILLIFIILLSALFIVYIFGKLKVLDTYPVEFTGATFIILIIIMMFIFRVTKKYYSELEYQKPIERKVIKYNEQGQPIDTVYIHTNL